MKCKILIVFAMLFWGSCSSGLSELLEAVPVVAVVNETPLYLNDKLLKGLPTQDLEKRRIFLESALFQFALEQEAFNQGISPSEVMNHIRESVVYSPLDKKVAWNMFRALPEADRVTQNVEEKQIFDLWYIAQNRHLEANALVEAQDEFLSKFRVRTFLDRRKVPFAQRQILKNNGFISSKPSTVTLIEFCDLSSEACSAAYEKSKALLSHYKHNIQSIFYPYASTEYSKQMAYAFMCAQEQSKGSDMKKDLLQLRYDANFDVSSAEKISNKFNQLAQILELDGQQFSACMHDTTALDERLVNFREKLGSSENDFLSSPGVMFFIGATPKLGVPLHGLPLVGHEWMNEAKKIIEREMGFTLEDNEFRN